MPTYSIDVPVGDPHNAQLAAAAAEDVVVHVDSATATLTQAGADRTSAIACIAVALTDDRTNMPRARLAAMLAVALVQLAEKVERR